MALQRAAPVLGNFLPSSTAFLKDGNLMMTPSRWTTPGAAKLRGRRAAARSGVPSDGSGYGGHGPAVEAGGLKL